MSSMAYNEETNMDTTTMTQDLDGLGDVEQAEDAQDFLCEPGTYPPVELPALKAVALARREDM